MDYSKLTFPPYVYEEYPKWVEGKEGRVLVNNAEEEAAVKPKVGRPRSTHND